MLIADADFERLEAVEHVELGQRDAADTANLDRLPYQHGVEPAAAAGPPGDGAEFMADLADARADLVAELAGEGTAADARRIGLGDAQHIADAAHAHA